MNLEQFLRETKQTQAGFGESVGVSQARICQLLAGGTPSLDLALKIAEKTAGKVPANCWGAARTKRRREAKRRVA
jgi:hypothetical protein